MLPQNTEVIDYQTDEKNTNQSHTTTETKKNNAQPKIMLRKNTVNKKHRNFPNKPNNTQNHHKKTIINSKLNELFFAISSYDFDQVSNLLEDNEDLINEYDDRGKTPLEHTIYVSSAVELLKNCTDYYTRSKNIIELLLEKGADPNQITNDSTPLLMAISYQNIEIVKLLLANGADTNLQDGIGDTPLHRAIFNKNEEIIELLLKQEDIDINKTNKCGHTPLMSAIDIKSSVKILSLLLEKKPTVDNKTLKKLLKKYEIEELCSNQAEQNLIRQKLETVDKHHKKAVFIAIPISLLAISIFITGLVLLNKAKAQSFNLSVITTLMTTLLISIFIIEYQVSNHIKLTKEQNLYQAIGSALKKIGEEQLTQETDNLFTPLKSTEEIGKELKEPTIINVQNNNIQPINP